MKKISFEGVMIFFCEIRQTSETDQKFVRDRHFAFMNFEAILLQFATISLTLPSSLLICYMTIQVRVTFWMTFISEFSNIFLVENQTKLSVSDTLQTSETDQMYVFFLQSCFLQYYWNTLEKNTSCILDLVIF